MTLTITVKCVGCGKKKEVDETQKRMPMCSTCGNPMIVVKAENK